ncbi:GntR family transcriptional regulator [Glycomyces sp. YM15]|uniref:GntR family transcriptional regulator n=1 Tax=Glycomyces sp. YM15 TaxID=2800446 RepID=UPI001963942D|nr:GntR family transcriptional regulator [Glycomyces sp. YM15]
MAEPNEPPYVRIAAELSRRIADRELAPGDKVPSTRQVAREFGVALATAMKALDVLRAEGLVITRPRSGTVVARRRGADGGATAELTRERLLAEAIEIADGEGFEAVSMRAVASRCGVAPMSLYRFVEDKDELVSAMADTIYGSSAFDRDPAAPWRSQVESLSRELWRLHRAHPWLGRTQPLTRPLPLPNIIRLGDRLLGALEATGLPPHLYFELHILLFSHILGLAANFEADHAAASETGLSSEEWTDLQYQPLIGDAAFMSAHPHFTKLFGRLGSLEDGYDLDLDGLFELGMGLLLDGAEALAARVAAGRADA